MIFKDKLLTNRIKDLETDLGYLRRDVYTPRVSHTPAAANAANMSEAFRRVRNDNEILATRVKALEVTLAKTNETQELLLKLLKLRVEEGTRIVSDV